MKNIGKLLIGLFLILILIKCLPTTEGWVDAPPAAATPYDLSLDQGVLITDIPAPAGTTAALVMEYTASGTGSTAVAVNLAGFSTQTGLSIDAVSGVISGTTGAVADVDGIFKVDFTGAAPVSQYIKMKIVAGNTDNIQPGNPPVIGGGGGGAGGGGGSATCNDGSTAPTHNPCDNPSKMADIVGTDGESPTAQNACTAIEIRKAEIAAHIEEARIAAQEDPSFFGAGVQMWEETTGPGDIMNNIVTTAGGNENSKNFMATVMNVDVNSIQMSDHESACSNSVGGLNLNEINISAHNADCQVRMIDALGPEIYAGLVRDGSLDPVIDVSNIDQTIQNKNKATCVMNSMQKSHSDQMSSVDNTALQESIQDMEGGGNINSDQGKCTEINTSQSACEYVKDKQCCMNSVTESRENLLSVGDCFSHVHDINQLIDTENDLTCASSDYQFQDTGQGTVVKDVETQRAKQAVTPNYAIYIGGAIVAVLLGLAGMYLLYKGGKLAYSKSPMGLAGSVMGDKPMPSAPPASALGGRWDALRSHDLRGAMGWQ